MGLLRQRRRPRRPALARTSSSRNPRASSWPAAPSRWRRSSIGSRAPAGKFVRIDIGLVVGLEIAAQAITAVDGRALDAVGRRARADSLDQHGLAPVDECLPVVVFADIKNRSPQTAARFSDSWNLPWHEAPSPNKQATTPARPAILRDSATPVTRPSSPPTMVEVSRTPNSFAEMCNEPLRRRQ